jgi:hypothetical protein
MDTIMLVENQIDDGRKFLDHLGRERFPVLAACWVKPTEEDRWSLYVVTPLVDEKGAAAAYREAYRILRSLGPLWVTDSEVKLIGAEHPVAMDVFSILRKHPGMTPIRWRGPLLFRGTPIEDVYRGVPLPLRSGIQIGPILGGMPIEEVYIYPPPRPRNIQADLGLRKLKSQIRQRTHPVDLTSPYTSEEQQAVGQLEASGMTPSEAQYWIWKKREKDRELRLIPAGTIVKANYAAWWGDKPEDDPNPLLHVETGDGGQGLTFLDNTEPAE